MKRAPVCLRARARPQRRIEKHQAEDLPGERLRLGVLLQPTRELEEGDDFVAPEIGKIKKALHAGRSARVSRSMSTCSSSKMNAGNSRSTFGSLAVPARMPHSSSSA